MPALVTRKVYVIVEPAVIPLGVPACLCSVIAGTLAMPVSVESVAGTVVPDGGVALAVAVFATCPASTSVCVIGYVAVQVAVAPGASVAGQDTEPTFASDTDSDVSVTLPVLWKTNE